MNWEAVAYAAARLNCTFWKHIVSAAVCSCLSSCDCWGKVSHQTGACLTDALAAAQAEKKKLKALRTQVSCLLLQCYKLWLLASIKQLWLCVSLYT